EQKSAESKKSAAAATDALAKSQEKLANWDKAYQEELAKVNAELSANKKEINDALKLQQAQDVVDAKQLDTYAQKQQYLSALNTLIRNHSTATEEDTQAIDRMVQESAALQAELKATDAQMQIYVRNVGNYNEAAGKVVASHKPLKAQLKELRLEMEQLVASGVSKTDEGYRNLVKEAEKVKKAIKDVGDDIKEGASDTKAMDKLINVATTATSSWQLYNSVVALTGKENDKAAESMQKMMAIMGVVNSLQQIQNSLLSNGSASARLYTKSLELIKAALGLKKKAVEEDKVATEGSTKANNLNQVSEQKDAAAKKLNAAASKTEKAATDQSALSTQKDTIQKGLNEQATNKMSVAQRAGAVASKTLSVALRAIPLMAIIGLVIELISRWEEIWNWLRKTIPVLDKVGKKFDEMGGFVNAAKSYFIGLVDFIKNSVIATIEGLWNLLVDFFSDWSKLSEDWDKMGQEIGQARNNAIKKANDEAQEGITKKQNEEQLKRLNQQKDYLDIEEQNNKRYSKKYRKLIEDKYKVERELAKGNADKLHEIDVQYARDKAEIRNRDLKADEEAAKARRDEANKAAEQAKKEEEQRLKEINDLIKKNQQDIQAGDELWIDAIKEVLKIDDEIQKKEADNAFKRYNDAIKLNLAMEQTVNYYKAQIAGQRLLLKAQKELYEKNPTDSLKADIDATEQKIKDLIAESFAAIDKINEKLGDGSHKEWAERYKNYLKQQESDLATSYAKRTEIAINSFLIEEVARKKSYKGQIDALDKNITQLQTKIDKAKDDEEKERLKKEKEEAEATKKILEEKLIELYGKYANSDIHIPIDLDLTNVENKYNDLMQKLGKMPFTLQEIVNATLGISEKTADGVRTFQEIWDGALQQSKGDAEALIGTLKQVLNLGADEFGKLFDFVENNQTFDSVLEVVDGKIVTVGDRIFEILTSGTINFREFGKEAVNATKKVADTEKLYKDAQDKAYTDLISKQDKIISNNEKIIKNFQEAAKGLKLEPAMKDDALSGILKGQIIDLDKTRERYDELESAYQEYLDSIKEGSEQMKAREDAWQLKLEATKQKYGENSMEYKLMVDEKEKSDAAYAMEYEKVAQQIEDISQKQADLMYDYIESIANRTADITKTIQENVMNPIFDGLSDLFAFQLEEAKEALDEITDLYDKAVEARENSAERMKEINEELRADDGQNKEALQQRLAEEEVLLAQREEAERALEKEKKKREYEVQVAEANQRKFELRQKLAEGIVNTALGATAALKYGFPLGPVFAAIITAMGALQTAIIAKQIGNVKMPQKYAAGGKVGEDGVSRSHKQGGHRIE
ncbi:MAG: hypothetical protein II449_05835, partial [Prevotella sp.]|nr:hypothetical protein [Prevotella sp.]